MGKVAKTIKEYSTEFKGWNITVPKGSIVSNMTACGPDDNYHFWVDFEKAAEKITGYKHNILYHDLKFYGLDIPAEYCEPYKKETIS